MKVIAVIPARWKSTRLKGKVLADINGKPMVQHVWNKVKQAEKVDEVIVAVDKERVFKIVENFGGKTIMTSEDHASGTDRIAEVADKIEGDIFLNIQADEPLIDPSMIDELVQVFEYEPEVQMATLIKRIELEEEINDTNVVKVVVDRKGYALYFSRSPIPHIRDDISENDIESKNLSQRYFKHIGLYAYTKDFLSTFTNLPKSALENDEKLEQLRVLEHGFRIKTIETRYEALSVDTEEDLEKVKKILEDNTKNGLETKV